MRNQLISAVVAAAAIGLMAAARQRPQQQQQQQGLPAGATEAVARLKTSPRHAEWVTVKTGQNDSVRAYLVYPERRQRAPVVVVIHEIYGLSNWVRAVADQLAGDGYIAIAPDLLTMKDLPQTAEGEPDREAARAAIGSAADADHQRRARMVAEYAMNLPAAAKRYGMVGYCWGGGFVWQHALRYPDVAAGVSYYGPLPPPDQLSKVRTPILGLYGENDARINASIPAADSAMKSLRKPFEYRIFPGAGHGFLRAQDGQNGANLSATKEAWPLTVAWFRKHLR